MVQSARAITYGYDTFTYIGRLNMKSLTAFVYVFSIFMVKEICSLELRDITVPSVVVLDGDNDTEAISLDCVYDLEMETQSLIVKWLKDDKVIYQWIRGNKPQVFAGYQETVRPVSTSADPDKQYRAVSLVKPNIETTGTYKCIVHTAEETETMEKKLQVVDTEDYALTLVQERVDNMTHVECSVDRVYPKPIMELVTDDNDTVQIVDIDVYEEEDGYYNATLIALVTDDDTDDDDGDDDENDDADTKIICLVKFSGVPFKLTTSTITGGGASLRFDYTLLLTILAALMMRFNFFRSWL